MEKRRSRRGAVQYPGLAVIGYCLRAKELARQGEKRQAEGSARRILDSFGCKGRGLPMDFSQASFRRPWTFQIDWRKARERI
jgi:hypothetical protein